MATSKIQTTGHLVADIEGKHHKLHANELYFTPHDRHLVVGGRNSVDGQGVFVQFYTLDIREKEYEMTALGPENDRVIAWYNPSASEASWVLDEYTGGTINVEHFSRTGQAVIRFHCQFTAREPGGLRTVHVSAEAELIGITLPAGSTDSPEQK